MDPVRSPYEGGASPGADAPVVTITSEDRRRMPAYTAELLAFVASSATAPATRVAVDPGISTTIAAPIATKASSSAV